MHILNKCLCIKSKDLNIAAEIKDVIKLNKIKKKSQQNANVPYNFLLVHWKALSYTSKITHCDNPKTSSAWTGICNGWNTRRPQ